MFFKSDMHVPSRKRNCFHLWLLVLPLAYPSEQKIRFAPRKEQSGDVFDLSGEFKRKGFNFFLLPFLILFKIILEYSALILCDTVVAGFLSNGFPFLFFRHGFLLNPPSPFLLLVEEKVRHLVDFRQNLSISLCISGCLNGVNFLPATLENGFISWKKIP